jgi:biotin carboxylase
MHGERQTNIFCMASFEKGHSFIRECKAQGCYVIFLTADRLRDAAWPRDCIDEFHTLPSLQDRAEVIRVTSYAARSRYIDRIVALDDYDVEMAATLREHLRVPGMGDTTARHFRDKLAMRMQAEENGILVPPFVGIINYGKLHEFMDAVPPPWVLKPRSEAATMGIKRIYGQEELWQALDYLGDRQSYFLLEKYVPGDVYHIDAIVYEREVLLAEAHKYGTPPLNVVHDGGLFISRTLPRDGAEALELKALLDQVVKGLGFVRGLTHTEFIRGKDDGRYYFLETAARVGGANVSEMIKAATGLDLWAEWAKLEIAGGQAPYAAEPTRQLYAGIIISLARQEWPDLSGYDDPEIVWRLNLRHHAGLVVASPDPQRVQTLLDSYAPRFYNDFFASQPALERPPT